MISYRDLKNVSCRRRIEAWKMRFVQNPTRQEQTRMGFIRPRDDEAIRIVRAELYVHTQNDIERYVISTCVAQCNRR